MKNGPYPIITIAALLVHLVLSGCKPENIDVSVPAALPSSAPVSLAVNPGHASMAPGTNLQLEAIGIFANNTTRTLSGVTWSSADPAVASIDGAGLVSSLPSSSGTTTITAVFGELAGTAVITISPLVSVMVSPADAAIAPGTVQKFTATGSLQNSATQDLTGSAVWQSSNVPLTVSGNGVATSAGPGTSIISATVSGITGTASLTSADVNSIAVAPFTATAVRGTTLQFTAKATLSNLAEQNITSFATWSSSSPGIALVNNAGLAASVSPGSAVITASFGPASGAAVLTVAAPNLVSISITPGGQTLFPGDTLQFTAVGTFSDGTTHDITADVTWISSNTAIASISNSGLATALTTGTAGISAVFSGITSNQVQLSVSTQAAALASISITPSSSVVAIGTGVQFTATGISANGASKDLTATATWSSSNPNVAIVSQGFATTLAPGTAIIRATIGNSTGSAVLTVTLF